MKKIVAVISLLFVISCGRPTRSDADNLDAFIQQKGDSLYQSRQVPGIFIGILDSSQRRYYNFGYADPDSKKIFDSATLFEIGSITKTFTACQDYRAI